MIVVDASVLVNALADDETAGDRARELFRANGDLAAPDLVDVETTAALRRRWLAGAVSDERFSLAVADLADIPIARFPTLPLMRRAFELRANVTAYDASYIALAEALERPLYTADRRLVRAPGTRCTVHVLSVSAS